MDEQRLAEIEAQHVPLHGCCASMHGDTYGEPWPCVTARLVAEVRRLQAEVARLENGWEPARDY